METVQKRKRILVVDDSESIRELIAIGLEMQGYDVIRGVNGEDGFKRLQENSDCSLVITDMNMPIMDGLSFLKKIRAESNNKFLPVLIITSEVQEAKRREAREAGATGWITKPFANQQLITVIKRLLN
jgi:two-component system, chemotaxis family, chemotaxis protein CheY